MARPNGDGLDDLRRRTVGNIAHSLAVIHDWDWDVAYAAAYAYKHNAPTRHSLPTAISIMQRSHMERLTTLEENAILRAYKQAKVGA